MSEAKQPQDRKPKQKKTPEASPAITEVSREVVDIGLDSSPILMRIFRGERIWEFNPDPSMDQWASVENALKEFREMKDDDPDSGEVISKAKDALHGLQVAISDLLVEDSAEFVDRNYGPFALQKLAKRLMEEVTGFPTQA